MAGSSRQHAGLHPRPFVPGARPELERSKMGKDPCPRLSPTIATGRLVFTRLLDEARTDVTELLSRGRIERAHELSQRTRMEFSSTYFPMYFTGAFESAHLHRRIQHRTL